MGKLNNRFDLKFIFDDKIFIDSFSNFLRLYYQIDDQYSFLTFYHKTKEFKEWAGFGRNRKFRNPKWWEECGFQWKEMS